MTTHHQYPTTDLDLTAADSAASTPRSDHHRWTNEELTLQPRVRFMCSFGGRILPRPHDNQLRYVGGDTRIVAVHRHSTTFSSLLTKLCKLAGTTDLTVKYQLPNEDLDALITVTTDEDFENMMDEYDRFHQNNSQSKPPSSSSSARLRLFLFTNDTVSRTSSISSLLDGSTKREHWFLDALNGGSGLERGRSEVSSIMSEMPDYLFGLDNTDEQTRDPKLKTLPETISNSDPGSPAPVVSSSPYCSTSSSLAPPGMPTIPELPPVKTKPDNPVPVVDPKEVPIETFMQTSEPLPSGYAGNPRWHYVPDPHYPSPPLNHVPVYYMPTTVPPENVPIQMRSQYLQQYPVVPPGQMPVGYHQQVPSMGQVYGGGGGGVRPMPAVNPYGMAAARVTPDGGMNQPVYYGVRNAYPGMVVAGGEEMQGNGSDAKEGRVYQS